MIYFEHCLREAGLQSLAAVCVLRPPGSERIAAEVDGEIREVFPAAHVHHAAPDAAPVACDLLIAIFSNPHRFPLQDVVYEELDTCHGLLSHARQARYVMLYRASWRTAEIVPAARLRAHLRRLRIERRLIALAGRSRLLRRLLQPQYGQHN